MHRGASLQSIRENNTAYCGSVSCARAGRRPRRTVSVRSKDWGGTGPEYVSGLSGLAQLAVAIRSERLIWIHIHVFIRETFHLIIIWPLRHGGGGGAGGIQPRLWPSSPCGSLSGPLVWQEHDLSNALRLLSQVHTLLSLCLSYRFSSLRHGLSLRISLLFAAASKQTPTNPPPPTPTSTPELQNKTNMRGTHPHGTWGVVSSGVRFYF